MLQGPNVHVVWDKEMVISQEKFNIIRVPETIIVDKNLNMVRKIVGAIEWDGTEMRQYLSQLRWPQLWAIIFILMLSLF